jgi:hypothetical protein
MYFFDKKLTISINQIVFVMEMDCVFCEEDNYIYIYIHIYFNIRLAIASCKSRGPGFCSGPVHVRFAVESVVLGQGFSEYFDFVLSLSFH